MNWFKKSLVSLLAAITLFGTGITTPIIADDGKTTTTTKTTETSSASVAVQGSYEYTALQSMSMHQ
jgi:hypothetical protein